MSTRDHDEPPTAAEARLVEHLAALRGGAVPAPELVHDLVRRARWQRAVRQPLHAAGLLLAALGEGVGILVRSTRRDA
jgi:hypothetical protein